MEYRGQKLVCIPSGMGGTLPAVMVANHGDESQVVCLHQDYFSNCLLLVKNCDISDFSYTLSDFAKKRIDKRLARA